jgi:Tfp pilus assembly protein PilV
VRVIAAPPLRSRRRRTAGFTIVETALAAFVMALGIATSLTALQAGLKATDTARNMTLAGQIIQSEIEIIRLENWSQICALAASGTIDPTSTISTNSGSSLDTLLNTIANRFTVTRTVADIAGRTDIKTITLSVTWTGIDGRSHNLTYQTRYAKDGLADYLYVSH